MKNVKLTSRSVEETQELAKQILPLGRIFALYGDLGTGKTAFVQGAARALGVREYIKSPTFTIMRRTGPLVHIDAYRLDHPDELRALGWDALLADAQNVIMVEWADRVEELLPPGTVRIRFEHINEHERDISIN